MCRSNTYIQTHTYIYMYKIHKYSGGATHMYAQSQVLYRGTFLYIIHQKYKTSVCRSKYKKLILTTVKQ